jgi:hypothetical protein
MSMAKNPKLKFLLILPIIAAIMFFGTTVMESGVPDDTEKQEQLLVQFAINYKSMMSACSEEGLDSKELQSCIDAFDEVREFCTVNSADQCGDKQMEQLEKKLSDL